MLTIFDYTKIEAYSNNVYIAGLVTVGLIFFILGWVMTKILRPDNSQLNEESHNIKKHLLEDLNSSRKFNSDYQLLAKKEKRELENKETKL